MSSPLTLRTLLGMHPGTAALKTGRVASPFVAFDYAAALPTGEDDPVRFGVRANERSIQQTITYAVEHLIARPLAAEELFADARRIIGDDAE